MKIAGNHYAAQSLIFGFPDPEKVPDKKPMPFDNEHPFQNLGIRLISDKGGAAFSKFSKNPPFEQITQLSNPITSSATVQEELNKCREIASPCCR